jgi:hypothetical protein
MIIILGDSWGVAEYGRGGCITGPGISNYISLHDRVINLSVGAASNTLSLNRLVNLFEQFNPTPEDRFFWIMTCPSRCVVDLNTLKNKNLFNVIEEKLYDTINRANDLAKQYCIQIELIGGLCDLVDVNFEYFENIKIVVPSWGKLLDTNYPACSFAPSSAVLQYASIDTKILDALEAKFNFWDQSEYFPDNAHPNKNAHKILRDYLFPEFTNKF